MSIEHQYFIYAFELFSNDLKQKISARVHELVVGLEANTARPVGNLLSDRRFLTHSRNDLLLKLLPDARYAEKVRGASLLHCECQRAL